MKIPGQVPFADMMEPPTLGRSGSLDETGRLDSLESGISAMHTRDPRMNALGKDDWDEAEVSRLGNGSEIFVFDFGVAVFWGVSKEEERKMLEVFRGFAVKGLVEPHEFRYGEDDMAFVTSPEVSSPPSVLHLFVLRVLC